MTLMKTLQKNGFSIPSNFFAIVSIPTVIKKKENLIVAAERGTRPKRQTEMVEFNISSYRSCFQVNLKFSPFTS